MRGRALLDRLVEVACALVAYALSRWIWQRHGGGVFDRLPEELGTFAALYLLLRLVGLVSRRRRSGPG